MTHPLLSALVCLCISVPFCLAQDAPTSQTDPRLNEALKRFPQADANKDGVLTVAEAMAFKTAMRASRSTDRAKRTGTTAVAGKPPKLVPKTASGTNVPEGQAIKGYTGLYMGHSFFRPAAEQLLQVIPETKVVDHSELIVFSGGPGGSPKALWENPKTRAKGQAYLDTGTVDLMAMTYFSSANSAVADYAKWFDYAVAKNPDVTLMLALPWAKSLYVATDAELAQAESRAKAFHDEIIAQLRAKYPNNKVIYCPYGLSVYELIRRYKKGELPGIQHLMHPDREAAKKGPTIHLLNDPLGHGSKLVSRLNALIWLQSIYDYDLSTVDKKFRVDGLPEIDLNEIAIQIHQKIAPYNAIYAK